MSERGESGSRSFPLRPYSNSPATPGPTPDPYPQPPASKELWLNFSQPPLLLGASESFSPGTFSFDLERERFLVTLRWGSCFSTRLGTLLLSALGAFLRRWERAWGGGLRGAVQGAPARGPLHPSLGAGALPLPIPAFPKSAEGCGDRGLTAGLPQGPNGMNGTGPANPGRGLGRGRWESSCAPGSSGQQDCAGSRERKLVGRSLEVASARVLSCSGRRRGLPSQASVSGSWT